MTIDKFISQWTKKPEYRTVYNNIIIDEMSMVDLLKLNRVLNFFEPTNPSLHRLILVGDPNQLPPIGYGKPFYDIIQYLKYNETFKNHLIELDVNCRKELEKNEILNFSKYFTNENDLSKELTDKISLGGDISEGFRVRYFSAEDYLINILKEEWLKISDKMSFTGSEEERLNSLFKYNLNKEDPGQVEYDMENFQVITPYRYLSEIVNLYYQKDVRENNDIDILKMFKNHDKIIRTQNYYEGNDLIISNGSIGLALKWDKDKLLCFPELEEKYKSIYGVKGIREREKEYFELAYCITVHKSQGSGFEHLIVVLPKRYSFLCKELFYTALSRSKKSISILIEGLPNQDFEKSLFEYARKRSYTENRKTSLMLNSPQLYYGLEPEEGIYVQSRVEQIIYKHLMNFREKYHEDGFDFKYEQFPIVNNEKVRIKTDFTLYTKHGTFYWEHLGMLSKSLYKKQWLVYRLPYYEKYNLHDQLITTDELKGISNAKIDKVIEDIITNKIGNEDKYNMYSKHHYSLR